MIRGKFLTSMDDTTACLALRAQVFPGAQGEADEYDRLAVYALTFNEGGLPGGAGRLYIGDDSRFTIDRVGVVPEVRGQGLGDLLMRMLLYRALELNCAGVQLVSPVRLTGFFSRYGLRAQGEAFEAGGEACRVMYAERERIDIEGSCSKGKKCAGCEGDCASCEKKEDEHA